MHSPKHMWVCNENKNKIEIDHQQTEKTVQTQNLAISRVGKWQKWESSKNTPKSITKTNYKKTKCFNSLPKAEHNILVSWHEKSDGVFLWNVAKCKKHVCNQLQKRHEVMSRIQIQLINDVSPQKSLTFLLKTCLFAELKNRCYDFITFLLYKPISFSWKSNVH